MALIAFALLYKPAQAAIAGAAAPLANWAQQRQEGLDRFGLAGQFAIGVLLSFIWIPCVGPTLGAATVLAAQGERLAEVALIMAAYAAGIASVLLAIAFFSRGFFRRSGARTLKQADRAKTLLGWTLAVIAALVLTGADHLIEGAILSVLPDSVIDLTVSL